MASRDIQEGRTDQGSAEKHEGSQDEVSDSSRLTQVRSDIGSPVMRKSNLLLRGRKEKVRNKAARARLGRQQTLKTRMDEGLKNPNCPSVSSAGGHSRKVSPGARARPMVILQRHQTVDPDAPR